MAGAAGTELLPEGFVFDVVPADTDTEPQSTAGQQIEIGCLARDERGLALRKDQDPGGELESFGDSGQIGEHHERIVERVVLGIGTRELGCSIGVNGTEHVVICEEVVKAKLLDREPESPDSTRVSMELDLRVDSADLHGLRLLGWVDDRALDFSGSGVTAREMKPATLTLSGRSATRLLMPESALLTAPRSSAPRV